MNDGRSRRRLTAASRRRQGSAQPASPAASRQGARPRADRRPTRRARRAAVFTTNLAQAAPILVSRDHLRTSGGRAAAIVVNSGCANACTGPDGHGARSGDGAPHGRRAAAAHRIDVLVASTGVIGVKLDMAKVAAGIQPRPPRSLSDDGGPTPRARS